MKRLLLIALALIVVVAALASQPWFDIKLTAGNNLQIAGFDAYPNFGPTLIMDALAIALVLYLHRRWGLIFLVAGIFATGLGAISQIPAVFGTDLGVLAPIVEKATGIASWVAQLEQVVVSHQSTFFGKGAFLVLAAVTLVQILALIDAFRRWAPKVRSAVGKSNISKAQPDIALGGDRQSKPVETQTEKAADLWKETNPSDL